MRRLALGLTSLMLLCLTAACQSSDTAYSNEEGAVPEAARPAKKVIDRYVELEQSFDPAVADLYLDEATITNLRHYPTGQTRQMTLAGVEYKSLIRSLMPLAKAKDDRSTYSDFEYEVQSSRRVQVTAERYSLLKGYASPITWVVVEVEDNGPWLIAEEHSESRP